VSHSNPAADARTHLSGGIQFAAESPQVQSMLSGGHLPPAMAPIADRAAGR
jgi:hypothetical protein